MLRPILDYLLDWRNWLTHGLVGVGFLLAAIYVPVRWEAKAVVIVCVIVFNVWRMRKHGGDSLGSGAQDTTAADAEAS